MPVKMNQSVVVLLLLLFLGLMLVCVSEASVHEYKGDKFVSKGNAFVVHAGSEGIYFSFSDAHVNETAANNGDSYIR